MVAASFEQEEEWRPVVGWEGTFSVSNLGRVRSEERTARIGRGAVRRVRGRILRLHSNKGRIIVKLNRDGIQETFQVHRLVLEAFVGPCPPGQEACHNDGNPADNRVGNLRWDTHQANMDDRVAHGTVPFGSTAPLAKLDEDQVRDIRRLRTSGWTNRRIAAAFGVTPSCVSLIARGLAWTHVSDEPIAAPPRPRGEQSHRAKLTGADVIEIRRRRALGESFESIAKSFCVQGLAVSRVCTGKTWSHIPFEEAA